MKKTIAFFIFSVLLAGVWFISAQAPPGIPDAVEATVESTPDPTNPVPGSVPAPRAFPPTIPVINVAPTNAAPDGGPAAPNPSNPIFQTPGRNRTNAVPGASGIPNRLSLPGRPGGVRNGVGPAGQPSGAAPGPVPMAKMPEIPKGDAPSINKKADGSIDDITLHFVNTPIDQVMDFYAELVGRMVLHSTALPATTISIKTQTPLSPTEARQALDTILALNGLTTVPIGDKMISLVPATGAPQEGGAISRDDTSSLPEAAQFITQVVRVTNALPSEVQQAITSFSKTPNAITALDNSGILVLRDYAVNVKRMLEMISRIDQVTESAYKLEVIPIKYGKVADIYDVMSGLIGGSGGGGAGGARATTRRSSSSGRSGTGRSSSTTTGSRFNNTGVPGQNNATPTPTAAVNSFQRNLQNIVSRAASGDSQILGDAKIIPDERANSLVVYADKRDMDVLTNIVAKLDVALAQVLIEAIVMEVSVGNNTQLGVSAVQQPKTSGKFTGAGTMNNGTALPVNSAGSSVFGAGGTNNASSLLGGNGLSYLGSFGNNFDVIVNAVSSDSTVNVISKPRIQTTHAVEASFFVGDTVPYITGTSYGYYGSTGTQSQYTEKEVGVNLVVTPYITPDGLVVMDISQEISSLGPSVKIDQNEVPTTTKRSAQSTVSVEDGKTIMLGGYISNTKTKSKSGIPLLKDIPVLGNLFRSKTDDNKRVELMVLMRPTVLKRPQDAARAADIERRRLPGVRASEREYLIDEQNRLDKEESDAAKSVKDKKKKQAND